MKCIAVADPSRSTAGGRRRPAAAATAYPIFLRRTVRDKGAHRQLAAWGGGGTGVRLPWWEPGSSAFFSRTSAPPSRAPAIMRVLGRRWGVVDHGNGAVHQRRALHAGTVDDVVRTVADDTAEISPPEQDPWAASPPADVPEPPAVAGERPVSAATGSGGRE